METLRITDIIPEDIQARAEAIVENSHPEGLGDFSPTCLADVRRTGLGLFKVDVDPTNVFEVQVAKTYFPEVILSNIQYEKSYAEETKRMIETAAGRLAEEARDVKEE